MTRRWIPLAMVGLLLGAAANLPAADLHLQFLQGLRERQYYDTALAYLEQIEHDSRVPAEVRQVLPFERAVTLLAASRQVRGSEARKAQLDQAEAQFELFVKTNPDHPRAAEANTQRAQIHLENARVDILESRAPANRETRGQFQERARRNISRAKEIFQQAHDQHKANWEQFDRFIDPSERDRIRVRERAEVAYMQAQLNLAKCTYEEAQTYDRDAPEFRQLLSQAAIELGEVHNKYRTMGAGLHAKMWQGKCFEEQGELGKALGIYQELLAHPGDAPALRDLKNRVRYFRFVCLNHEQRGDHQLVADEATEWLTRNGRLHRTEVGLGIRFERARALEALAARRDMPEAERTRGLRQGLDDVTYIERVASPFRGQAITMKQRFNAALGRDDADPKDFDTAFGRANNMLKEIGSLREEIEAAGDPEEKKTLELDLQHHLDDSARVLRLALDLAGPKTDVNQVHTAQYRLAYVHLLAGRSYDAAVLGEYVARRSDDPTIAQDAAYMALAAWIQASHTAPGDREFETQRMAEIGELIVSAWPESDRALDARMNLGLTYKRRGMSAESARWYGQVPATAPQYAEAQLNAGQAYWEAYLKAGSLPADEKPSRDELQAWQQSAETHLRNGIERTARAVPEGNPPPADLIAAKVTLAHLCVDQGRDDEAIALLRSEPHSVLSTIALNEGESRPPPPAVKSTNFASLVYQLLLRAYVGRQMIDEALAAMDALEEIIQSDDGGKGRVAEVYARLGRELQEEIERLREIGEQDRLQEMLTAFDQFLGVLYDRRDGMRYGSLQWMASTYKGLGQSMADAGQTTQADSYFRKAGELYQEILDRIARRDPEFPANLPTSGIKLQIAECLRLEKRFEEAIEMAAEILVEQPRALDAQFAAAEVLQSWGASGRPDAQGYLLEAINGREAGGEKQAIWGWGGIARQLSQALNAGRGNDKLAEQYYEAAYNSAWCRHRYGLEQASSRRDAALKLARAEIEAFARLNDPDRVGDAWWDRFDQLYRTVQADLGETPVALVRPEPVFEPSPPPDRTELAAAETQAVRAAAPSPAEPASSGLLGMLLAVGLALACTAGVVYGMVKGAKPRPRQTYGSAPVPRSAAAASRTARPNGGPPQGKPRVRKTAPGAPGASNRSSDV